MRYFTTLFLFIFLLPLTAQVQVNNGGRGERVTGNGDLVTEQRNIDGFTGIKACCSMKVELAEGPFDVRIEAESNLQEFVRTEVKGDRLEIGYTRDANFKSKRPIRVFVTLPKLESLAASSSSTVTSDGTFHGEELSVDVSSSATARLAFIGEAVDTKASSSATLVIEGEADKVSADASSSSRIDAGKLTSKDGQAKVSSSADVILNLEKSLKARASSSGSVTYFGSPSDVITDTNSSGSVTSRN